jgi:hypothetical protein
MRILLLGAILFLLAVMPGALHGPRGADATFSGDFNCDGSVNTRDVITVLAVSGGVQPLPSCSNAVSVDCDGDTDVTDALVLLHYLAATSVSLPAGCSDINTLIPGTSPQDAADQLLARITGGGSLPDVIDGVQEALARGGVSTGDANGTTYTQAFAPTASNVAIPMEVLNLALEARGATTVYRMDAAQVGQMLADFGWPFFTDSTPGEQIVAMLQEFVTGAQALPNDPNSFTPLFLQAMGKIQDPPVDLSAGDAAPENVHFNLLELRLLVAMFDRQAVYTNQTQSDVAWPAADDPCTEAKKVLSGALGPFGGQIDGILVNEAGPHFIEKALEKAGVAGAATIGKALESLAIVSRLWKLVDFYSSVQVAVSIDGAHTMHKPLEADGPELKLFKATAGLSEEDWKAYQEANTSAGSEINQAVRDCMNSVGLKVLSDLGDIAKDAEHWKVDWTISNNDVNLRNEPTITWTPDDQVLPGETHQVNWRSGMIKESEFSSDAHFIVRVGTERQSDHDNPVVKTDDVRVCGSVFAAEPPDLQMLVNAAKGPIGLIESIAELGAGWLQTIDGPQACATLTVTWHEPCALAQAPQPADAGMSPASQAQPESVSIEAITSLDQLPCAYEGTASAINTDPNLGTVTLTVTASDLRFERTDATSPIYVLVRGNVTMQASGGYGDCTASGGSTIPGPIDDGVHWLAGVILFEDTGVGVQNIKYGASGHMTDNEDHLVFTCSLPGSSYSTFYNASWLLTSSDGPDRSLTPGGTLEGSFDGIVDQFESVHSQWSLHPAGCQPSPVPVCQ